MVTLGKIAVSLIQILATGVLPRRVLAAGVPVVRGPLKVLVWIFGLLERRLPGAVHLHVQVHVRQLARANHAASRRHRVPSPQGRRGIGNRCIKMALAVMFLICTWIARLSPHEHKSLQPHLDCCHPALTVMPLFQIPFVSQTVFQGFSCRQLDENEKWLDVDFQISCTSNSYLAFVSLGFVGVLVYPLGLPTCVLLVVVQEIGEIKSGGPRMSATSSSWQVTLCATRISFGHNHGVVCTVRDTACAVACTHRLQACLLLVGLP